MGERRFDDAFHFGVIVRHPGAPERDERGVDIRPRPEDGARNGMEADALGHELHEDRDGAIGLRRRDGKESVGDLALHHHAPARDARKAGEALDDDRRRDVVREVGDELRRAGRDRREVERKRVAEDDADVRDRAEALAQLRLERSVELDSHDTRDAVGEERGEGSEPRADLENHVVAVELGEAADPAEYVLVDEEVLAEVLLRRDPHGSPNTAAAFAAIRSPSSAASSPRVSARAPTVCTTCAGSFGFPRTGCGARYGQSVSARILSAGTARAARRRSSAFGKVTLPANET